MKLHRSAICDNKLSKCCWWPTASSSCGLLLHSFTDTCLSCHGPYSQGATPCWESALVSSFPLLYVVTQMTLKYPSFGSSNPSCGLIENNATQTLVCCRFFPTTLRCHSTLDAPVFLFWELGGDGNDEDGQTVTFEHINPEHTAKHFWVFYSLQEAWEIDIILMLCRPCLPRYPGLHLVRPSRPSDYATSLWSVNTLSCFRFFCLAAWGNFVLSFENSCIQLSFTYGTLCLGKLWGPKTVWIQRATRSEKLPQSWDASLFFLLFHFINFFPSTIMAYLHVSILLN